MLHAVNVVAANCTVEVKPYSAYGTNDGCVAREGYVKLNGATVWEGGWCSSLPNKRGTNILLVDLVACTKQESRRFDTHLSEVQSTQLNDYLDSLTQS